MDNYNTYSGTSIAQQLLGNSWLGRLLYGKPETYKDGYGTERQHASLPESANGQELQRMGDTAKTTGKIALTGFAFTNPFTTSSTASSMLGTLGQSYFLGEGLKDAKYRIQNGSTAGDGVMLGLDLLPATSVAKTIFNGAKNIGPALKQIVKNAEYADYMGRLNDASKYNTNPTITNVTGASDIIKSKPYARMAPSDGRINPAVNYNLRYDPKNFIQVISDTEPGYYSVHFKTDKGSPTSNNIQQVVNQIVSDLPGGSKLATWGSVTKGGFSGLNRFGKAGMIKTGEYRPLTFKDQSVANEVAEKYRLTLNADGTINWPIVEKLRNDQLLFKLKLNPNRNSYEAPTYIPDEYIGNFLGEGSEQQAYYSPIINAVIKIPLFKRPTIEEAKKVSLDFTKNRAISKLQTPTKQIGFAKLENEYVPVLTQPLVSKYSGTNDQLRKEVANALLQEGFVEKYPGEFFNNQGRISLSDLSTDNAGILNGKLSLFDVWSSPNLPKQKNGGKIHIKERNKGKFTKAAKAVGESVQEHAHNVINDPNATTLQKKRAQFAINAKKWHK